MSLAARLLNVFAIPGDVFAEVKATVPCMANWLVPALLLIAVCGGGTFLAFSQENVQQQLREITDRAMQKQAGARKIPPEAAEQALKVGGLIAQGGAYAVSVIVPLASPFWWGLILWLGGAKVFKGQFSFMKAVEVAGLVNTIAILEAIIKTLLIISFGNLYASPSPALLIKDFDPQNPFHTVWLIPDVMTFWLLTVRSIGLSRLAGTTLWKAAVWVIGIWAGYTALFTGIGFAMHAVFGK